MKNTATLEKRIDDFLCGLKVPEDTISGTLALCTMCSLLTISKEYAPYHAMDYKKVTLP